MKNKVCEIFELLWFQFKKKFWYIFLLTASSIYLWNYRNEIYQLKELNVRNLIFLVWLLLLLFPLFSEMELLGVKIKKAVEKANEEVKDEVEELKTQITELKISNSIANTIHIGNGVLPSKEDMEELLKSIVGAQNSQLDIPIEETSEGRAVYLFKVRLNIEKALNEIIEKTGFEDEEPVRTHNMIVRARILRRKEVLDSGTLDLIMQVVKIANRGVHGEVIGDEYIEFVQKVYPEIQWRLKEIKNNIL